MWVSFPNLIYIHQNPREIGRLRETCHRCGEWSQTGAAEEKAPKEEAL